MPVSINVSSTWKELKNISQNVSGVWKDMARCSINVSGVWKTFHVKPIFYQAHETNARAVYIKGGALTATGGLRFGSSGTLSFYVSGNAASGLPSSVSPAIDGDEWLREGTASEWQVRLDKTSGSDPNDGGLSLATWYTLTSNRDFGMTVTGTGSVSRTGTFTVSFKKTTDGAARFAYTGTQITAAVV